MDARKRLRFFEGPPVSVPFRSDRFRLERGFQVIPRDAVPAPVIAL
jgi:hypothetical protein